MAEDSPPPTIPQVSMGLRNYAKQEDGERVGQVVFDHLRMLSRVIDLERLDGVTSVTTSSKRWPDWSAVIRPISS